MRNIWVATRGHVLLAIEYWAWLANPLLLFVIVRLHGTRRVPWLVPVLLVACAVDAMFWTRIAYDSGWHEVLTYHIGYYIWLVAVLLGAVWSGVGGWNPNEPADLIMSASYPFWAWALRQDATRCGLTFRQGMLHA